MDSTVLIIGTLLMIVVLVFLLVKRMNPQFALILVGLVGMLCMWFGAGQSTIEPSTGNIFFDAFSYLQTSLVSSFTSTGITLCVVLGYVEYMNRLKASDMFALTVAKPISKIKSKYAILIIALLFGCVIKWVIPSAVTSFLMLYATVYPVLRRCGIGRITAVTCLIVSISWSLGPGQPFTGMIYSFAPESGMTGPSFFINYELVYFIPVFIVCAIAFILTTKFFEKRDEAKPVDFLTPDEIVDEEIDTKTLGIPGWYGLLPIIPLILVIVLGGQVIPTLKVGVVPIYALCALVVVIIEMIRRKNVFSVSNDFFMFLDGMGVSFGRYATVVWAGTVFADGLSAVGGLDLLINMLVSSDTSVTAFMILISVASIVLAALSSQVVLCIFSLSPIVAAFCGATGADAAYILLPLAACACAPGLLSCAAAVTLVSAEKAGLPVMSLIVRIAIPIVISSLAIILCCVFMFAPAA